MKQLTQNRYVKRAVIALLCAIMVFSIIPLSASGASRVNIESSETGTKYFEYLSGSGSWTDLKNSVHWIVETGEIAYCLQNKKDSPHAGDGYEEFDPYTSYSTRVYNGLTIILESGFPADKPSYLTDDEARYATANAIRFWLTENGDPNFYSYHDRDRNQIRAKSGYEDVLAWADALLEKARNQEFIISEVNFSPSNLVLTESGGKLTGTTTVDLVNLNGGYTLDKSTLPSGVEISGFTGKDGDVLTISAPTTADLKFTLTATGLDNRTTASMFWYAPTNSANQTLVTFAEGNFAPKEAGTFTVSSTGTPVTPPEEPEEPEEPVTGGISVQKINSNPSMGNHSLSGAQFGIYKDGALVTTLTTNSAGVASVDGLELGAYTVREITAPWGFVLSSSSVSVTVSSSATEYVSIGNKPQVGTITVTKEDSETGNVAQGDAILEGAKYEVRDASGNVVDTLNALGTRVVTSRQLPLGTYYIHETQPPVGYLLNTEPIRVVISYAGQNVEVATASTVCEDDVIKGQISVVKFGSRELTGNEQDSDIKPPLEGVEFEIRLKSSGVLYDTLVTDADGKAISDLLPYGTYIISETKGIDGYELVEPFEVFVSEHGEEYAYILEDKSVEMRIRLVKTDADTGNTVPIAGTTFKLTNSTGEDIAFNVLYPQPGTIDRFTTDASGTLYLPEKLANGTYRLYEIKAPEGYLIEDDYVTFNVNEDTADYNTVTVKFPNEAVKGTISIEKQGEMLTGVTIEETEYGEMHIPEYTLAGVEDAVFAIYAAENIGTPDGTVYYKEGQLVQEVTTDERGYATTKELYLGKYEIVEKSVPLGFVLDTTPRYATLEYADQHTEVVTEIVGLENERQKAEIQIAKSAEYFDPENAVFETLPGEGFVFGVYTSHNIFGVIEENTLVDVITTDKNGRATTTTDLPVAKYYNVLGSRGNSMAFSEDSSYPLLCSLENLDENGKLQSKADMFTKRTIKPHVVVTSVDTAVEALAVSLGEKARIDMDYMGELTGKTEEELYSELSGVIFLNPLHVMNFSGEQKYLTADEYLSGNVRESLDIVRGIAKNNPEFEIHVSALEKVQPKDLTAGEIAVKLGTPWIPPKDIEQFTFELLETSVFSRNKISVQYSPHTCEWRIEGKNSDFGNVKSGNTHGTSRVNAYKIIEDTLNLRDVRVFDKHYENGKEVRTLNSEETMLAQTKQEGIKLAFSEWIWKDPDRRERLCKMYNETFNSTRPREYDGEHLTFPNMNPEIILRPHQKDAIARTIYGGNTLLAHVVGSGKTFTMVGSAMEQKRLGLCSKSMMVVPNHLTEQWAAEFLQLYPSANILVATKKSFERKNRRKFCSRIATGDYDAIIIGHSQFEKIPVSIDRQQEYINSEIRQITDYILEMKQERLNSFTQKQLELTKKRLEIKLEKLTDRSRKDDVIDFEELGIDRIFVDESHSFKNLETHTKMRNVAGLSQTEAQKSSDMFLKCRYMDELTGGHGIIFATGTPVSNTLVELYTIKRYLAHGLLRQKGLLHFDAWAGNFAETQAAMELAPEGKGFRIKTRLAKFFNLPELMTMFKEFADIQTADMLDLPVPDAHFETVVVKPTQTQSELVGVLAERAESVRNRRVDPNEDNMLIITNDGRKLALDQRIINPSYPDEPNSKINTCVKNVYGIWEQNADKRSTQIIFCDLSTPTGGGFNVYADIKQKLIGNTLFRVTSVFTGEKDLGTALQNIAVRGVLNELNAVNTNIDKISQPTY